MLLVTTAKVSLTNWEKLIDKFVNFLPTLITAIIIFIVGIILTKLIVKILGKGLQRSKLDITAHGFIKSLVRIALYTIVVVIALSSTKIVDMSSLVAIIGAAGLAVGLALQSSLSNLAGGFIILFFFFFTVGDFIESNFVSGAVNSITILYTRLLTADNKVIYIPNGQVSGSKIVNFTQEKQRRLDMSFGISYSNDYHKAIEIIKEVISNNSNALAEPEPLIRVGEHGANSINIVVRVWVLSENYWNLNYDLLEQIKTAFDENGIEIPYNKLDIHVDK